MLFFPKYDKEGPGVYADDPPEGAVKRFFQTLGRKFWQLILLNLIFVLFNIPSFLIGYLVTVFYLPQLNPGLAPDRFVQFLVEAGISISDKSVSAEEVAIQLYLMLIFIVVMFGVGMMMWAFGPAQTGLNYVYRNFAREIPGFIWSDFWMALKRDFKQSIITSIISFLASSIILFNILFYSRLYTGTGSTILFTLFVILLFFFLAWMIFVYPLIASVDLKLKSIYRNAGLFLLGKFLPSLGIFFLNILFLLGIPILLITFLNFLGFAIAIIYFLFIGFALTHYLNAFFVWQQIEKYILKPQLTQEDNEIEDKEENSSSEASSIATIDSTLAT